MNQAAVDTLEEARTLVLGVVTARFSGSADDAAMLIQEYLTAAVERGLSLPMAWTYLFSASTMWLADCIEELADIHGQSPPAEVNDIAVYHALEVGDG